MTLKAARVNIGLTQDAAAKLIGISRATLSSKVNRHTEIIMARATQKGA